MARRTDSLLNNRDAHAYIGERLGGLAPAWETWCTWMRTSGRRRHAATIRARRVPRPRRIPGIRGHVFSVADLDRFIARTRELSQNAAGNDDRAPAT